MLDLLLLGALLGCSGSPSTPTTDAPATDAPAPVPAPPVPDASATPAPAPGAPEPSGVPAAPSGSAAPPWNRTPFRDRMHEQFAAATDAVYGVILGDLDMVHEQSLRLYEMPPPPDLPEGWQSYLDAMKVAAKQSSETSSIEDAAADVLTVGRTCANCHKTHGGPSPSTEEVLGSSGMADSAMDRHSYGVYLMWLGLFLPSQGVFVAGVEQVAHDKAIPAVSGELSPLEGRVHELATRAGAAKNEQERVGLFAELLRTCADCHNRAGARIPR